MGHVFEMANRNRGRARPGQTLTSILAWTLFASPAVASAFECIVVSDPGEPRLSQAWNQRCVPYWIRRDDPLFSGENVEALVVQSFETWSSELACTDFELMFMGYTSAAAGFDPTEPEEQQNVVLATRDAAENNVYFGGDADILALTVTAFSVESGEIFDSDIIFNNVANLFEALEGTFDCAARPQRRRPFDIRNTLVHEVGHLLGFDHVPELEATMFARAGACEVMKRDLEADDVAAVCTVYATGETTATCAPPPSYDDVSGDPTRYRDQCKRALDEGDCSCRHVGGGIGLRSAPWIVCTLLGLLILVRFRFRRTLR